MNNGWCFSRPKLAHAQPEIYLKNHVNTPMQPFHVATHETQWHSWWWCPDFSLEKKKNTPSRCPHSVVAIGGQTVCSTTPCHSWPPTTLRLLGQGPNSQIFSSSILHFSHTISLLPLIFLSFFNNKCWIEEGINRKRSE